MSAIFFYMFILLAFGTSENVNNKFIWTKEIKGQIEKCEAFKHSAAEERSCDIQEKFREGIKKNFCRCMMPNKSDIGVWTILIKMKGVNFTESSLFFDTVSFEGIEDVPLIPGNGFYAKIDEYIRVHMNQDNFDGNETCLVYYDGILMYNVTDDFLDNDVERYGLCGIQMRVRDNREGAWTLVKKSGTGRPLRADFTIVINRNFSHAIERVLPNLLIGTETDVIGTLKKNLTSIIEKPPGLIEQCIVSNSETTEQRIAVNGTPLKFCRLRIQSVKKSDFGKWTSITILANTIELRSVHLINNFYIFETIQEEELEHGLNVFAHHEAVVRTKFKHPSDSHVQKSCRLIHETSGRQYDFADLDRPMEGLKLVDENFCQVEILLGIQQYGKWRLEERSNLWLRKGYLNIKRPATGEYCDFFSCLE